MADIDLVPLKRVLDEVGVSRTTLWRALKSDIEGMPKPTKVRGRLFWRKAEVPLVDSALDAYAGRGDYERTQSRERVRAAMRHAELLKLRGQGRRRRRAKGAAAIAQPDLFGR